jgi:Flp pilus assembly protein TadG
MSFHAAMSRLAQRFARDSRGVAAVEFAYVLPLMLTLYLGGTEVSQGISASRKVTLVSRAVADLASQVSNISNASMTNILSASSAIVAPYPTANLRVTVSCVKIDANGNATIAWSDTQGGTARAVGSGVTLPAALNVASTTLIWSEVQYTYTPTIGYVISGSLTLKDQMYMRPRQSDTITRSVS